MISVIIPAYNEEKQIGLTIRHVRERGAPFVTQIIISDGGSSDNTIAEAKMAGAEAVLSPRKGRAAQMNYGASFATSPVLYFLHADTLPPAGFSKAITDAVNKEFGSGCFMLQFDYPHWFLEANCWFTRFDINAIRFGDQSLFVQKEVFEKCGGFSEKHIVMEDQEIIRRIRKLCRFIIIKKPVITSTRKYLENGIYKTQGIYFLIYFMYRLGYSQQKLLQTYRSLVRQDKM